VGTFTVIRPRDDKDARQASDWCDELIKRFSANGHTKSHDVDDLTPPNSPNIVATLGYVVGLVLYFGHGTEDSWQTSNANTFDATNIASAKNHAFVSIACKTGTRLGPDAITGGAVCWLSFTAKVAVIATYKNHDPIGDALVNGLASLATGGTMQQARDDMRDELDKLVTSFDTGALSGHPAANFGYFAAMAMRDHVVLHGTTTHVPL
jgi:Peptidase family C25